MATTGVADLATRIIQSLKAARPFGSEGFDRKLRLACRDTDFLKQLSSSLKVSDDADDKVFVATFPKTEKDLVSTGLNDLGLSTMVLAMAGLDNDYDSGFKEASDGVCHVALQLRVQNDR